MSTVPPIIPISDLRQDAANILQQIKGSMQPTVITQRGRPAAIMLSVEAYEQGEHDRQLLMLLAKGDKEIDAGEGYSLDSVMTDADKILQGE
ncbi:MAG: type II toxin-antitoxin system Phd/YefM family antitoxin [Candidatus Marinimicrobia bacterium]|nr:type II toxin-antitoxin system Phd/YefM family antitoxin [Candidatus Neomarinimicrobiota bacterium]